MALELKKIQDDEKFILTTSYSLAHVRPESHVSTSTELPTQLIEPGGRHVRLRTRIP